MPVAAIAGELHQRGEHTGGRHAKDGADVARAAEGRHAVKIVIRREGESAVGIVPAITGTRAGEFHERGEHAAGSHLENGAEVQLRHHATWCHRNCHPVRR